MNPILNKNLFLIKEHLGIFKAANNYDIFDPEDNSMILKCREEKLGIFTKIFRFTDYKRMTPFEIEIKTIASKNVLSVKRGTTIFRSVVEVFDENNQLVGYFRQRMLSLGGKFEILDQNKNQIATLQGKWTGWDFKFMRDDKVLAQVNKKWAGIGKEFFTSADNYVLQIEDTVPQDDKVRLLILAAVMCIDMVLKE